MKKIFGIRHIRYFFLKRELGRWFNSYRGPGCFINPNDWAYLNAVWKGEA
jgi:hypothetical protein